MAENKKGTLAGRPVPESGAPVPSRAELVQALVNLLMAGHDSELPSAAPQEPLSANEFERAIKELHDAGFTFNEEGVVRRRDLESGEEPDGAMLVSLQERYPLLPAEVSEVLSSLLTGDEPDVETVGSTEVQAKQEVIRRHILTEDLRERFFLRSCGKLPRFRDVDWEVVVKVAERGLRGVPNYPYALVTLNTLDEAHGHHEHKTLSFAVGRRGLRHLMAELTELQARLDDMHRPDDVHQYAESKASRD